MRGGRGSLDFREVCRTVVEEDLPLLGKVLEGGRGRGLGDPETKVELATSELLRRAGVSLTWPSAQPC